MSSDKVRMLTVATAVVAGVVAAVGSGNSGFPLSIVRDGAPYDTVMSIPSWLNLIPRLPAKQCGRISRYSDAPAEDGEAPNSKLLDRAFSPHGTDCAIQGTVGNDMVTTISRCIRYCNHDDAICKGRLK